MYSDYRKTEYGSFSLFHLIGINKQTPRLKDSDQNLPVDFGTHFQVLAS